MRIQDALAAKDSKMCTVPCPEWGGDVYLTTLPADLYDEFSVRYIAAQKNPQAFRGVRAEFVAACWADEQGNPVPLSKNEVAGLQKKSSVVMSRLWDAAQELHNDIEEEEKN